MTSSVLLRSVDVANEANAKPSASSERNLQYRVTHARCSCVTLQLKCHAMLNWAIWSQDGWNKLQTIFRRSSGFPLHFGRSTVYWSWRQVWRHLPRSWFDWRIVLCWWAYSQRTLVASPAVSAVVSGMETRIGLLTEFSEKLCESLQSVH